MPALAQVLWKHWYQYLSRKIGTRDVHFLNYGYWPDSGRTVQLEPADEPDRLMIQLYHHVAGGVPLTGKDLLEVSCGHGGGASFIQRYHKPGSYTAIDQNPGAIDYCRRTHAELGIRFAVGDAQVLDFPQESFDAVLNVEASHCYPDEAAFFQAARRVLRPGGHLLFADFRPAGQKAGLEETIKTAGLEVVESREITREVLAALKQLSGRYRSLVEGLTPRVLHRLMRAFAAVEGSSMHTSFENGERVYLSYTLRRA